MGQLSFHIFFNDAKNMSKLLFISKWLCIFFSDVSKEPSPRTKNTPNSLMEEKASEIFGLKCF